MFWVALGGNRSFLKLAVTAAVTVQTKHMSSKGAFVPFAFCPWPINTTRSELLVSGYATIRPSEDFSVARSIFCAEVSRTCSAYRQRAFGQDNRPPAGSTEVLYQHQVAAHLIKLPV